MAAASIHVMNLARAVHAGITDPMHSHINVGTGEDVTIAELARLVGETVGFSGRITFDASKPDGTPRKLLDVSKLAALGWRASTPLADGLRRAYAAYLDGHADADADAVAVTVADTDIATRRALTTENSN